MQINIQITYLELIPITSCLHSFFHDNSFDPYSSSWKFCFTSFIIFFIFMYMDSVLL